MTKGGITEGIGYGYNSEAYNGTTDMQYLRYRHYSPSISRFNVIDSYLGEVNRPLSRNRYTYAENNPVMGIDPSGRATDWWNLSSDGIKKAKNTLNSRYALEMVSENEYKKDMETANKEIERRRDKEYSVAYGEKYQFTTSNYATYELRSGMESKIREYGRK